LILLGMVLCSGEIYGFLASRVWLCVNWC
jgi:hypothetical protein